MTSEQPAPASDIEERRACVRRWATHDLQTYELPDDAGIADLARRLAEAESSLTIADKDAAATDVAVLRALGECDPDAAECYRVGRAEFHGSLFESVNRAHQTIRNPEALRRMRGGAAWPYALQAWRHDNAAQLGAARWLSEYAKDALATHPKALGRLRDAVRERTPDQLVALQLEAWMRPPPRNGMAWSFLPAHLASLTQPQDGMFILAARWADFVELGLGQREVAHRLREAARKQWMQREMPGTEQQPWELWTDAVRLAYWLAGVLWTEVRAQLERETQNPPALSLSFLESIAAVQRRGISVMEATGDLHTLQVAKGKTVQGWGIEAPAIAVEGLRAMVQRLGSLNAIRTLHYEVLTAHAQHIAGVSQPERLSIQGGWAELARRIGANSKTAPEEVRAVVFAQAHLVWHGPDGSSGNLLSYREYPEAPGRQAELVLALGDMLLPGYVHRFDGKESHRARTAKRLVPMLAELPPVIGARVLHGPQAVLHWHVLAELQRRAAELYRCGGVLLTDDGLAAMAGALGLVRWVPKIMDRWTQDGTDGPAFLRMVEVDRYTLGPAHKTANNFLLEAGKRDKTGRQGGLKSAAAKRLRWGK